LHPETVASCYFASGLISCTLFSFSPHRLDVFSKQVPKKLAQVEASNCAIARCQGRVVLFHATCAELTAVFGVADQGLDARPAVHKTGVGLRVVFR
jgi:hypothetical protein